MAFGTDAEKERRLALEMQALRAAQGQHDKFLAEKAAYMSGAKKTGGFLGFGGEYAPNVDSSGNKVTPESNANMNKSLRMAEAGMKLAGVGDGSNGSTGGGVASGALMGASTGAAFGAPGALIGAGLGGALGALKAKSARKKMRAEAQARMHERLGEIEGNKALRLQEALSLMAGNIGATLRSV